MKHSGMGGKSEIPPWRVPLLLAKTMRICVQVSIYTTVRPSILTLSYSDGPTDRRRPGGQLSPLLLLVVLASRILWIPCHRLSLAACLNSW